MNSEYCLFECGSCENKACSCKQEYVGPSFKEETCHDIDERFEAFIDRLERTYL